MNAELSDLDVSQFRTIRGLREIRGLPFRNERGTRRNSTFVLQISNKSTQSRNGFSPSFAAFCCVPPVVNRPSPNMYFTRE
jgi:hypothetical protein